MPNLGLHKIMMRAFRPLILVAIFQCLAPAAGAEPPLPQPEGPVVLTITGMIAVTNRDGAADFDRAMLADVGDRTIRTGTIWTEGQDAFAGPLLVRLLDRVGGHGTRLEATALNKYVSPIPVTEIGEDGPIVARLMNGEEIPVRQKGPLWIVYPFDTHPEFRNDSTYARSVWQLRSIHVTR